MKPILFVFLLFSFSVSGQDTYLSTPWTVSESQPLPEYPRPQMVRPLWQNLNGHWDYAIVEGKHADKPDNFEGKIRVPFAVESALSGVKRRVGKDSTLWYKREFLIDKNIIDKEVLLHFGAVDWSMVLYVNGVKVGSHEGGFDPFFFNITPYLKNGTKQEISLSVWDPTNDGPQPNGKQVNKPHGIWYTPVSGIWQTVWLEGVPKTYIVSTRNTPDVDRSSISVQTQIDGAQPKDQVRVSVWSNGIKLDEQAVNTNEKANFILNKPKLWSPENPFLYDLKIELLRNGRIIDQVNSYFAMRKLSMKPDNNGIQRLMLNNQFLFQYGPLDQGWWPDGLYTAPTDDALKFDIEKTKEMGFNMIRKHIKVEPARWYYHCDKLGILVWQDMPSGDLGGNAWDMRLGNVSGRNLEKVRTIESENIFKKEWKSIMDALYNFQSIVVWVPFNEAWGQFKTVEITEWTKMHDPSRLVNSASGGNFFQTGDILDIHNYPDAQMPDPQVYGRSRALVLGEYGGLGLPLEGHTWQQKNNWGYQSFTSKEALLKRYTGLIKSMEVLIYKGLSAAVYTQTTDVEIETNGLMTYDRKVVKMPEKDLREMHDKLYKIKVE